MRFKEAQYVVLMDEIVIITDFEYVMERYAYVNLKNVNAKIWIDRKPFEDKAKLFWLQYQDVMCGQLTGVKFTVDKLVYTDGEYYAECTREDDGRIMVKKVGALRDNFDME